MDTVANKDRRKGAASRAVSAYAIAITLAFAGVDKLFHYSGFVAVLQNYAHLPVIYAGYAAPFVPFIELWIAVGLIFDRWRRPASFAASLMLTGFALALAVKRHFDPAAPCGCWFTVTLGEGTAPHILFDLLLAALSVTLWAGPRPASAHTTSAAEGGPRMGTGRSGLTGIFSI